jgi:hypothetical protein
MMPNALDERVSAGLFLVILVCFLEGCRPKLIAGKYRVAAIGEPGKCLYLDKGGGGPGRVDEKVIAVGWDDQHVIVKQKKHSVISYFIIEHTKDCGFADAKDVVTGPLSEEEFWLKRKQLNVSPSLEFTVNY